MEEILIEGYRFIKMSLDKAEMVFSTAKNGLNFNKSLEEGKRNLENIKKWFEVKDIGFLDQVHGDSTILYNEDINKRKALQQGDALITNLSNTAIGIFTADCVPILLYDKKNNAIAAVHSGWKGTLACILSKTIDEMKKQFNTNSQELIASIGPHNRQCCYEVGEEVMEKFKSLDFYSELNIFNEKNLNMKNCIEYQLKSQGIKESNIYDMKICTFCNKEYKMHSYRKNKDAGRMFSFIYLKG